MTVPVDQDAHERSLSQRPLYNSKQLEQYFEHISLPDIEKASPVASSRNAANGGPAEALRFLTVLQRHQLCAVPFENLEMHYSVARTPSIDPQALFEKIVGRGNGRGGYCVENNCFFGTVLRSLGYSVLPVGARVNEAAQPMAASKFWKGPKFDGWNHMLNLVSVENQRYLVDVGFGSNAAMKPLPLQANLETQNPGTQTVRLVRTSIPQNTNIEQTLWVYQYRNSDTLPWTPTYCFSEVEFIPDDFHMINYFMSTHKSSWFTYLVVVLKMIMDDSGEIIGDCTMFERSVKKTINGKTEVLRDLESEEDRLKALREFFGIKFHDQELACIKGLVSELR